jgi:hypothetical protein
MDNKTTQGTISRGNKTPLATRALPVGESSRLLLPETSQSLIKQRKRTMTRMTIHIELEYFTENRTLRM